MMPLTTTPPTSWVIEVYLLNGSIVQNLSTSPAINSAVLINLTPGTIYKVQVGGVNSRGIGNYSEFGIAQTYRGDINTTDHSSLNYIYTYTYFLTTSSKY